MYRGLQFTSTYAFGGPIKYITVGSVPTWEFPVLAKYRFSFPLLKPIIEAGPSFRIAGNLNGTSPSNHGFVIGVGLETGAWKVKISPQVRYIRWAADTATPVYGPPTNLNQVEILLGITI